MLQQQHSRRKSRSSPEEKLSLFYEREKASLARARKHFQIGLEGWGETPFLCKYPVLQLRNNNKTINNYNRQKLFFICHFWGNSQGYFFENCYTQFNNRLIDGATKVSFFYRQMAQFTPKQNDNIIISWALHFFFFLSPSE